ncbi:hypothetical protein [Pseudomonas sp. NyZ201]|uniref:hypothetical protein n=1 Tax=Pseudomonas sp. NyZ201 TaxID=3409857 RepID=UPI003CE742BE
MLQAISEDAKLRWKASKLESYELIVNAVDGCMEDGALNAKAKKWSALKLKDVEDFSLAIDSGMVTLSAKADSGQVDVLNSQIFPTWSVKEPEGHSLHRFVSSSEKVNYWGPEGSNKFVVQLPLLEVSDRSDVASKQKTIKINANGTSYIFSFKPASKESVTKACSSFDLSAPSLSPNVNVSKSGLVQIIVELRRLGRVNTFSFAKISPFEITGVYGWLSVSKLSADRVAGLVSPGIVQGLQIAGNIDYLRLNGEEVKNLDSRQFSFYNGSLKVRVDDEGDFVYQGVADWVWADGKRLNRTRWESLDGATQGILLTLAGLLIIAFFRVLHICMRDNDSYRF